MDHFLIFLKPGKFLDINGLESLDAGQDLGGEVDKAFGTFLPFWGDAGDRVAGLEVASYIQNA